MSKIYDKEYGLPSQYLLNKKKRPAKTDGKYLYYYVGASISDFPKGSKLKKYKNASKFISSKIIFGRWITTGNCGCL